MIHRIIDIRTEGLAAFEKDSRRLLLCLEYRSLVIAMVNAANGEWTAVEMLQCSDEDLADMEELIRQVKQQSALIHYTGLDTKIVLRTPNAMMIPAYLQRDSKRFLDIQFGPGPDVVVKESVNPEITAALKTMSAWITPFTSLFPDASLHSSLGILTRQCLAESSKNTLPLLYLLFGNGLVEMVIALNGQLLIARCFRFNAVEDMNYHVLNACRQLHIATADLQVKVQGLVEQGSPLSESITRYFTGIQFHNAAMQDWNPEFKTLPPHYFTSLIGLS